MSELAATPDARTTIRRSCSRTVLGRMSTLASIVENILFISSDLISFSLMYFSCRVSCSVLHDEASRGWSFTIAPAMLKAKGSMQQSSATCVKRIEISFLRSQLLQGTGMKFPFDRKSLLKKYHRNLRHYWWLSPDISDSVSCLVHKALQLARPKMQIPAQPRLVEAHERGWSS